MTLLISEPIAIWTRWHLGRTLRIEPNYDKLVARILGLWKETPITLGEFIYQTSILTNDFDWCMRHMYADGTVVNERIDRDWLAYVRVNRYANGKITGSYRLSDKNDDWDFLFSSEFRIPDGWTALDLSGYIHNKTNFKWV